jgi:hypothetical protein
MSFLQASSAFTEEAEAASCRTELSSMGKKKKKFKTKYLPLTPGVPLDKIKQS